MKTFYIITLLAILVCSRLFSQVGINTDGSPADSTAIFDIKSTNKGLLIPRMTADDRNFIMNPAEGLMVFCTNCGLNGTGVLCIYTDGDWYAFNICKTSTPTLAVNELLPSTIIWRWNTVAGATGYKWNTINSYDEAADMGSDTSHVETGVSCDTTYTRYVWAYDGCGPSAPIVLTQYFNNCWVCGEDLMISHDSGSVAPENKLTNYGTITGVPGEPSKCWITKNLGSSQQATSRSDNSEASAGWYWQFNRMRGYKHDGSTRTPNTTWINEINEFSVWIAANDPCALELGAGWRIPSIVEWENVDASNSWTNWNNPYNGLLKMHAAGHIDYYIATLADRGVRGYYWSSTQSGVLTSAQNLYFTSTSCINSLSYKAFGFSVRCVKD